MRDYSNTWLNTQPHFFNTKTLEISKLINDCIDYDNFDWDWAGLTDYLDFGFVVFGNTPIKNVKFVQANQSLEVLNSKLRTFKKLQIKVDSSISSADEIEDLTLSFLKNNINRNDRILLPLSGGFDSRYLASIFKENFKNEIKAYTFGTTFKQSDCNEVIYARKVAELLNIEHNQILIKDIFSYTQDWDNLFGVSCHSHGAHQMRFYHKIKERDSAFEKTLSGLVGDAWAGKVVIPEVNSPNCVLNLGLTHGLNADSNFSINKEMHYREEYFAENRTDLEDPEYRLIETIRNKMMLLRYLEVVPEYYGSQMISPFADETIARRMLRLPDSEKLDRIWQMDYFKSKNLNIEDFMYKSDKRNQLNKVRYAKEPKPFLKPELLKEIYNVDRIKYINKHIGNGILSQIELFLSIPFRGRSLIKPFLPKNNLIEIICEYMTLLPLQLLIERRDKFLNTRK